MKKVFKWLTFSGILGLYFFLYVATAKSTKCDDECQKFQRVDSSLSNPVIYGTYRCRTNILCIYVNDSLSRDWTVIADSACYFMKQEALLNFNVAIVGTFNRDTLLKQKCP